MLAGQGPYLCERVTIHISLSCINKCYDNLKQDASNSQLPIACTFTWITDPQVSVLDCLVSYEVRYAGGAGRDAGGAGHGRRRGAGDAAGGRRRAGAAGAQPQGRAGPHQGHASKG